MLFDAWHPLGLVAARGDRGAQVLAQMSSYDLVVTIALGSLVASIPFTTDLALADGVADRIRTHGVTAARSKASCGEVDEA